MKRGFADHFSAGALDYQRFRPDYPEALFDRLAVLAPRRELALDCASGSGQAVGPLAARCQRVVATDPAVALLARLVPPANTLRIVARAEQLPLPDGCVDLLTVAQGLHWLDLSAFFAEASRVLRPGGVLAAWAYGLCSVDGAVDPVLERLYARELGAWWPPERALVDEAYASIVFPFAETGSETLSMTATWSRDHLLRYLGTWSAVRHFREVRGEDPLLRIEAALRECWPGDGLRTISWPLTLRFATRPR